MYLIAKSFYYRLAQIFLFIGLATGASAVFSQEPVITISGADLALERNIRSHLDLGRVNCETELRRLNRNLPTIRQNTIRASRAIGYYHLELTATFSRTENCWELHIQIDPGEPVHISSLDVRVLSDDSLFSDVLENLPLAAGDQLNHASYETIKATLSSTAIETGFFEARFETSQLLLDLQGNTAAVVIRFNPGPRFRFGTVEIEASDVLSDEFVSRYIDFEVGAYYSSEELIKLRNSFNESLYFNAVTVTPALDRAVNQTIPIQVALQVRPRRVYSVGGGITTDIGPRIRLDYEDRYLNPMGHKFEIDSGFSPIQQMIELNYRIPMTKPSTENLSFSGGILNEDNDTFASESFKLGSTYSLINRNDWRQNYFVNFQHDDYQINDKNEIADTLITGINLARTRADDALYPRRGWRLFAQLSGASEDVLSTESFLQFNVNGKLIRSFGPGRFLVNFQAGTTLVDDIGQLPVSVQYFTGGDQSVRGYKYQSLGPTNEAGEVVGGKHFLTGSIEYDFNIRPAWKLAVFADAGNAFNEFNNFEVKKSVGLGLRWMSPIGPIRVDLASALDDDNKFRLHISMGPDL